MNSKKLVDIRILKIIFSFISIFVCIFDNPVNGYEYIFLMPLTYLICVLFTKVKKEEQKNNIAYISIDFLTFLKYSIMPFLIVLIDDYYAGVLTAHIPDSKYIIPSIFLCCIECIAIFITLHLFFKYRKKRQINTINSDVKIGIVMKIFIFASLACILVFKDGFFPNQLLVIDETYENSVIQSSVDGLIKIIFFLFKVFVLLYSTQFFVKKYKEKNKFIYIIGIFISLILYLIMNTSTSRWGLVLPVLVYLYILRDIWFSNRKNKTIIYIIGIILAVSFISISLFKFSWLFSDNDGDISITNIVSVLGSQLQEYVSGPRAIAQGIETVEVYRDYINYETLINDFTGSIPYISKYVDQGNRINIYYNYLLKGTKRDATQIMPMITIGYAYFTYILSYIFIVICIYLCLHYGEKEKESNNIFFKYIYSIISIRFALCIGFNTQIIFAWYVSNFIPFVLITKFNNLIKD